MSAELIALARRILVARRARAERRQRWRDGALLREGYTKSERPRCGARCRSKGGAPCVAPRWKRPDGTIARRCRMHGGASTGARTPEGRARLAEAGRRGALERWRRWREGDTGRVLAAEGSGLRADFEKTEHRSESNRALADGNAQEGNGVPVCP